jgi:hypothetical protein
MKKRSIVAWLTLCAVAPLIPVHAETTPEFGGVHLSALADAHIIPNQEGQPTTLTIDNDDDFQTGTIQSARVRVNAVSTDGAARVRASGHVRAKWKTPAEGTVEYEGGWDTRNVTENGRASVTGGGNLGDWVYTFSSDVDQTFVIKWDITADGTNTEGLDGFVLKVNNAPFRTMNVNTNGQVSFGPISAGTTVVMSIVSIADTAQGAFEGFPLGTRTARMKAKFKWRLVPVS